MKSLKCISLPVFLLFIVTTHAQELIGTALPYASINGTSIQLTFSSKKNIIAVSCQDENDAKNKIAKDFAITTQPGQPDNMSAYIKPSPLAADKKTLSFDLKNSLGPGEVFNFAFVENKKKIADLKLSKETEASPPPAKKYNIDPSTSSGVNILQNTSFSSDVFKYDNNGGYDNSITKYHQINQRKSGSSNILIYSFCDNSLYSSKDFKPNVNEGLTIQLNKVPNPLKYSVSIHTEYKDYNTQVDSFLQNTLFRFSPLMKAESGGNEELVDKQRKEKILSYLQKINTQLGIFLDKYTYSIDCIDAVIFSKDKQTIEDAINNTFSDVGFKYPGNLNDFIINEFTQEDTGYVNPVLKKYQAFKSFNVTPLTYNIPKLKNSDELIVILNIKAKENVSTALMADTSFNMPIFGGFKVDVSPGLFYTHFNSDKYFLRSDSTFTDPGDTVVKSRFKTIGSESTNKGNFGFSTLMHFYSRWGKNVNVSANLGVGLTLDDKPEVRYFTGISLLFGRVNRIALTGGWAWGQVEKLSDKYFNTDGSYKQVNFSEASLETKKVFASSWFVALSYNVPLLKRSSQ